MKPILFIVFLALGPMLAAEIPPAMAHPVVVVGSVEALPETPAEAAVAASLTSHDAVERDLANRNCVAGG